MSDITKCTGHNCPIKEKCYRFVAESEPMYQSYFVDVPGFWEYQNTEGEEMNDKRIWKCDVFWGEKNNITFEQLNKIFE